MRRPLAAMVLLMLGWSSPAAGEMVRYAVIVGNDVGTRDEARLRFAETDAAKVYQVLKELGGIRPENAVVLRGESAETVRRAVIAFNARLRGEAAGSQKRPSMLLVYYSMKGSCRWEHTSVLSADTPQNTMALYRIMDEVCV